MRMLPTAFFAMMLMLGSLTMPPSGKADQIEPTKSLPYVVRDASRISIQVEKGLLSVSLKDADLFEVMDALAKESGVKIKVDKGAQKRISLSFKDMPFEKGVRNIIRPLNHAMIWKNEKDTKGQDEQEVLVELHVFREGHQGSEAVVFAPGTAEHEEGEPKESKVHKRVWSEETRKRMLERLQVRPSPP